MASLNSQNQDRKVKCVIRLKPYHVKKKIKLKCNNTCYFGLLQQKQKQNKNPNKITTKNKQTNKHNKVLTSQLQCEYILWTLFTSTLS